MNQREIYDQRYSGLGYDERSKIPVLTAEMAVLDRATRRVVETNLHSKEVTLLDFASGSGRVTKDFAGQFATRFGGDGRELRVIAYDVSSVGLSKSARSLVEHQGFIDDDEAGVRFDPATEGVYVAGSVSRISENVTTTVVFVHGSEDADPDDVGKAVMDANGGRAFSMTTSWYSGLSHIPTAARRGAFFAMLDEVTDDRGELLISASVSGDLVDLQSEWARRLQSGDVGGWPIELPGDVIYETELGQKNYWHVFGEDLPALLEANRKPGQSTWMEAIRMPDPEFESYDEEQKNYQRVLEFNDRIRHESWDPEDFRQVHTAAAIRSGSPRAGADQFPLFD